MTVWHKENNQDKAFKIILFLVSPFISFLYSLRTIKTRSSYTIFFLVALFFGMSFTVSLDSGFDGAFYRAEFEQYTRISFREYKDDLEGFLNFDEGKKDYYFETVAFCLSRVTGNYHVMFLFFAFVFAFFSLKTFKFLTAEDSFDASLSSYILAYLFMINQIFNINGVRFWTAAWIGCYAVFQIFRNGNKIYFLLALLTPFFHGSFWVFIVVVALAYLLSRFEKVWVILFFVSFIVSSIAMELITNASDFLPVFMQKSIAFYTDADYVKLRSEEGTGFSWVPNLFLFLVRFYMNLMVYLFIKNATTIKANPKTKNLYLFILFWMTFVNFVMPIPSLGGRYFILAFPVISYIWLVNFKGRKYKKFLYTMPVVFSWSIFWMFYREYPTVTEIDFYIGSPFYLIYKYLML